MTKRNGILAAALTLAAVATFLLVYEAQVPQSALERSVHTRTIQYTLTVRNASSALLRNSELRVFAPMKSTGTQRLQDLRVDRPYTVVHDEFGNQMLKLDVGNVYPYETQEIRVRAVLQVATLPTPEPEGGEQFMAAARFIESDDARIRAIADKLPGDTARARAKAAFDWVRGHLTYSGYLAEDHGALWALAQKRGDCTEFAYLYAALLRAQRIPARVIGGFVVQHDTAVRGEEFHNWVEAYIDGHWRVVDPQGGRFMQDEGSYIAMRVLVDGDGLDSQRFAYSDAALNVVMR